MKIIVLMKQVANKDAVLRIRGFFFPLKQPAKRFVLIAALITRSKAALWHDIINISEN